MSGGVFAKLGHEYEQDFVILHWLKLLHGQIAELTWEPTGGSGQGTDVLLREDGKSIAVQCKTKSTERGWQPGELRGVLQAWRARVSPGSLDRVDLCRFQSNGSAAELDFVCTEARRSRNDPKKWIEVLGDRTRWLEPVGFEPTDAQSRRDAVDFFAKVEVVTESPAALRNTAELLASLIPGADVPRLLSELRAIPMAEALRALWAPEQLRTTLANRGLATPALVPIEQTLKWMAAQNEKFIDRVKSRRPSSRKWTIPEVARTVAAIRDHRAKRVILLHGTGGSGKSEALVAILEALPPEQWASLAVSAEEWPEESRDPVNALVRIASARPKLLVVDQLDQALAPGTESGRNWPAIRDCIRRALNQHVQVLLACRSVDAGDHGRLTQELKGLGAILESIEIGDLTEATAAAELQEVGLPWIEIPLEVRSLAKNALFLALLLDHLKTQCGDPVPKWASGHGVALVEGWTGSKLNACSESARAAFERIIAECEQSGRSFVEGAVMVGGSRSPAIQDLIRHGLIYECGSRLNLRHQMIGDVAIGRKWAGVHDSTELGNLLGPREDQTLLHARRLRLSMPLLVARGPIAEKVLRPLAWSRELRPLVWQSALQGLAESTPTSGLVKLVEEWMDQPHWRADTFRLVLASSRAWFDALWPWVERQPAPDDDSAGQWLIWLLGRAAADRSSKVAEVLHRWMAKEPGILNRCDLVFLQDPTLDEEPLFDLRLEYLAVRRSLSHFVSWDSVLSVPSRGLRLLHKFMELTAIEALTADDQLDWMEGWPEETVIPKLEAQAGPLSAKFLENWWCPNTIPFLEESSDSLYVEAGAPIEHIVRFHAGAVLFACESGSLRWSEVKRQLGDFSRLQDRWFLLEVGAAATRHSISVNLADDLAETLVNDLGSGQVSVGIGTTGTWTQIMARFLVPICKACSPAALYMIQNWAIHYREPGLLASERLRMRWSQSLGAGRNDHGRTTQIILSCIPREHLRSSSHRRLEELNRKFGVFDPTWDEPNSKIEWVASPVPADSSADWDAQMWRTQSLRLFRDMSDPESENDLMENPSLFALLRDLERFASQRPLHYLEQLRAHGQSTQKPARGLYWAILNGVWNAIRSESAESLAIVDADLATTLNHPDILDNPVCARPLAWIVLSRPNAPWPELVIGNLMKLGRDTEFRAWCYQEASDLKGTEINEPGCLAIRALGEVASKQPTLRLSLLQFGVSLVNQRAPARRSAAISLIDGAREADSSLATRSCLALCQDHQVAAQTAGLLVLRRLTVQNPVPDLPRGEALDQIRSLVSHSDPWIARRGGAALVWLREAAVIPDNDSLHRELADFPSARIGATEVVVQGLREIPDCEWLRDYALTLCDDGDASVRESLIRGLMSQDGASVLRDVEFLRRVLSTRIDSKTRDFLLKRCMRQFSVLPAASEFLAQVEKGLDEPAPEQGEFLRNQTTDDLLVRLAREAREAGDHLIESRALDLIDARILRGQFQHWLALNAASAE